MPSRRRAQPQLQATVSKPHIAKRQPGAPMLPATLAVAVGMACHDRHLAGIRLGASRRLGAQLRLAQQHPTLTAQERQRYIEEAAYYRYLQRGGVQGSPEADWYAAEQDVKNTTPSS
jgi:hypothetical protein